MAEFEKQDPNPNEQQNPQPEQPNRQVPPPPPQFQPPRMQQAPYYIDGYAPPPPYLSPEMQRAQIEARAKKSLRKQIRSDAGKVIALVLGFQLFMQVAASMVVMLYTAITGITGKGFSEPVYDFVFSYLPVVICESLALIAGLYWFKTDVRQLFRKPTLEKKELWKAPVYTGFSLGAIQLGAMIFTLYYLFFQLFGIEISVPMSDLNSDNAVINVLSFCYIVIFGPLLEEIFFRGILFQKLRKYGDVPTIMLTAVLFGLFHMNFVQLPGPIVFGIAIGIVCSKTNSLWLCWIIHALNNFIAVMYDYLPEKAAEVYNIVITYGLIGVGVICALLLLKDLIDVFKNRRGNTTVLGAWRKLTPMFNNVWFYAFLVFWFIMSMLTQFMA